jgi:hypothetical protein
MPFKKFAKDFGSKEIILNYANRRWGFTKTNKVGEDLGSGVGPRQVIDFIRLRRRRRPMAVDECEENNPSKPCA